MTTHTILLILITSLALTMGCSNKPKVHGIFAPSRLNRVLGQDGVSPIVLNNGYTLWTFGDTLTGYRHFPVGTPVPFQQQVTITYMHTNSLALSSNREPITGKTMTYLGSNSRAEAFIPLTGKEDPFKTRIWPFSGIELENRVFVYYTVVDTNSRSFLDFSQRYTALAEWTIPEGWKPGDDVTFKPLEPLFPPWYPYLGTSVVRYKGYLYITGHDSSSRGSTIVLARVRPDSILRRDAYRFLKKDGRWVQSVFQGDPVAYHGAGESALAYHRFSQRFFLVFCSITRGDVRIKVSATVEGLMDADETVLFTPEKVREKKKFYYTARIVSMEKGRIWIIYIDPQIYQPILVEIPVASFMN